MPVICGFANSYPLTSPIRTGADFPYQDLAETRHKRSQLVI